jgi:hypothetical protein
MRLRPARRAARLARRPANQKEVFCGWERSFQFASYGTFRSGTSVAATGVPHPSRAAFIVPTMEGPFYPDGAADIYSMAMFAEDVRLAPLAC